MRGSRSSPAHWAHCHWPYCCAPRAAINPFLSRVLLYINRTNGCFWIRSGLMGFAHQAHIIYSSDLTVPDVLSSVNRAVFSCFPYVSVFVEIYSYFWFLFLFCMEVHVKMVNPLLVPQVPSLDSVKRRLLGAENIL